jgi:Flp pilus assembly protein TadD
LEFIELMRIYNKFRIVILIVCTLQLASACYAQDDAHGPERKISNLFDQGRYAETVKSATEFLKADPRNAGVLQMRSWAYDRLHQTEQSMFDINTALKIEPGNVHLLTTRGAFLQEQHRYLESYTDFCAAYRKAPGTYACAANLGEALIYLKRYREAIPYLDQALRGVQDSGEAYYYRSLAYENLGDAVSAQRDSQKAKALNYVPTDITVFNSATKKLTVPVNAIP